MARGATWGATWHLGHVAEPGWPARGAGGTDAWQEATQTGPRNAVWGATCGWIIEEERIILIGESIPLFNRVISSFLFRVGLCSHTALTYAGRVAAQ